MSNLVERVARAIFPATVTNSEDYCDVPVEMAFVRPRYQHLRATAMSAANYAISEILTAIDEQHLPTDEFLRNALRR